jgi:uncharacterized damage-inducible protein DinB
VLRASFDRHVWATKALIDAVEALPRERLDEGIAGTYGSIAQTLTHLVDADDRYLLRLTGPNPPPHEDHGSQPLAELRTRIDANAALWKAMLDRLDAGTLESSISGRDDYPDTPSAETMLLIQALHHGDDHRAQVCSTLGALELDVPDLDGWTYWAEGRG